MYTSHMADEIFGKLYIEGILLYKVNDGKISKNYVQRLDRNEKYKCLSNQMGDKVPKLGINDHEISIDEIILKLEDEHIIVDYEPRDEKELPLSFIFKYDKFLGLINGLNKGKN